jgi:hypothetical protein
LAERTRVAEKMALNLLRQVMILADIIQSKERIYKKRKKESPKLKKRRGKFWPIIGPVPSYILYSLLERDVEKKRITVESLSTLTSTVVLPFRYLELMSPKNTCLIFTPLAVTPCHAEKKNISELVRVTSQVQLVRGNCEGAISRVRY